MHHPHGRHRRPAASLTARLWQLATTILAGALAYVLLPEPPGRTHAAIAPAPERPVLSPVPPIGEEPDPDEVGGALVRPYVLLAEPTPGEFDELAGLVRRYLDGPG
ncbi:hypothetical protein AB0I72_08960 [Nocardiopsis sp. NPDC049922]|uniref:hypothetical protein n=1 Tax=Nocardiopsis sp. NPDC049922 TaxID=3155157 RepID=UPI003401E735